MQPRRPGPRSLLAIGAIVLALTGCQSWSQFGYGSGLTAFNPKETKLGVATVASLGPSWTAGLTTDASWLKAQEPVVVDNVVYVSNWTSLAAFSADATGCGAGSPPVCAPLWTAPLMGITRGSPSIVGSTVIVVTEFGSTGRIQAFDRHGATNCSGSPKTCAPLWTAVAGSRGSVTVAGSNLYVSDVDTGRVLVFDADGSTNCTGAPVVCSPLWSSSVGGFDFIPAVSNGRVFAASFAGGVAAFDANGVNGCAGSPLVCTPLWQATAAGKVRIAPVAANGLVYVVSSDQSAVTHTLQVYDAAGSTNCTGTPLTCAPVWSASLPSTTTAFLAYGFAVDAQRVYVPAHENLLVFSASGTTNCAGVPKVCEPLWRATSPSRFGAVSVANDVVFASTNRLVAFHASGTSGCSGTPVVCAPLFTSTEPVNEGQPVTDNGRVYVVSVNDVPTNTSTLRAYALPPT